MVMGPDGRTLSQNEIDAMLKATAQRRDPPPHSSATPSPTPDKAVPASQNSTQAAPASKPQPKPEAGINPAIIADLVKRLDSVEAAIGRINKIESSLAAIQSNGIPKLQDFQAVVNHLKKITGQVENIIQLLQNTPGVGIHKNFHCSSCGTENMVVSQVKCSKCGKEKWLGWWPKK